MASGEYTIPSVLGLFAAGYGLAEITLPKHERSSTNASHSAVAAVLGLVVSGVTFGFTKNMETSLVLGSFMVGVAANRGLKWMGRVH